MSNEKKLALSNAKGLIPELRFPEFKNDGDWQRSTIGKIGKFYYGKSAPKWSLSNDAPTLCVRYGELYTKFDTVISKIKSRTNIETSNLKFSKGGEILIPRVGEVPQDFAKNCCYLPFPNIAIGEMISVYETKEYPIFYAYYFRTLWKQFAEVVEGQNVKNLYYVNLEPIVVGKPSYLEQQKIAFCLSSLDEVIAAQKQKLDALKEHKKALMQNLFPQEGEKVPKLRFKDFVKDGDWEKKKLGEVAELTSSKRVHLADYVSSGIPFFRGKEISQLKYNHIPDDILFISTEQYNEIKEKYGVPQKGDILITAVGTLGNVYCIKNDSNFYFKDGNLIWMKNIKINSIFLEVLLDVEKEIVLASAIGSSQKALTMTALNKLEFKMPKNPKEQEKIADSLTTLGELIKAQADKLEKLKLHKKGLMQGLFPNS